MKQLKFCISLMIKQQTRLWLGLILMGGLFFPLQEGQAQQRTRIIILPFNVYAEQGLAYLSARIPEVLKTLMEKEGAIFPELEADDERWSTESLEAANIQAIRELGRRHKADYVIWGGITWLKGAFSIDSRLLTVGQDHAPAVFYQEGAGIETLSSAVKELADNIAMHIFKWEKVAEVTVQGNKRIEADAVKRVVKTKPGSRFSRHLLAEDLKAVYQMGFFDDIRIEAESVIAGKHVIFHVTEKPTVRKIIITGASKVEETKISENLTLKTGSILNVFDIYRNIRQVESVYKDANYHHAEISYKIIELDNNQADLEIIIAEGDKVMIKTITFLGHKAFTDKELKALMKTREKDYLSWLTSRGDLKREVIEHDVAQIRNHYLNNGYMEVKISDPLIEMKDEWIFITIKIEEGQRYRMGKVNLDGELIQPQEELLKKLRIAKKEFYDHDARRRDVMTLQDLYSEQGFAFVNVATDVSKQEDQGIVDITYTIAKGSQVYFDKIIISGNTRTRDKVIRRQLHVYEQELYSFTKIQRSLRNLHRLDYFEDIKHNVYKGAEDDKMNLKIDVSEKSTGMFTFGGGYSSVNKLFMQASVAERNLFGRGQVLQLKAELGGTSNIYQLSFTEPWLFDIPLTGGVEAHNWVSDYDTYDRDRKGGGVRLGYRVFDYTNVYLRYVYDIITLKNIAPDASDLVKDMDGKNVTSSVSLSLSYDSRDRMFNPTEGADHTVRVEYAGLGGDVGYTKYTAASGYYIPLLKSLEDDFPPLISGLVGFVHAEVGYARQNTSGLLPDYERFYLGGMNSLRGFKWMDIHSVDEDGAKIGGNKYIQFNAELLIPLLPDVGIVGVLFFDTGNVFNDNEAINIDDLRETAGFGFRWYSPMGPIRIENGYILDRRDGESKGGKWDFTMGFGF